MDAKDETFLFLSLYKAEINSNPFIEDALIIFLELQINYKNWCLKHNLSTYKE
jgi:hypothetical protein